MKKKLGRDLTEGSIPRHLLAFSVPLLLGNLMQIGYSLVNTIWVGHLVGENAVGAIGVSFPIFFMLMGFGMGISMATTILISQYFGAKDHDMVERVANTSYSISLVLGVILTIVTVCFSDFLLRQMNTPPEIFALASSYLKISVAGFILLQMGVLINFVLRGIGDSMTPMVFMAVGLVINAALDPFLIGGFGPFPRLGLNGAAYASIMAQGIALATSIIYLNRSSHWVAFHPKKLILDSHIISLLFKIGLPTIVQQSLLSLGNLFITTFVNFFGSAAINAFGAVVRVDMFAVMPAMSMSMAVSTLTGQNLGAHKPHRVKEIFKWGIRMTAMITLPISVIAVFFSGPILKMFGLGADAEVMRIGINYLRIVGASYIFFAVMFITNGVINGSGHTLMTMIFSLLSLWVVRVPGSWLLSKKTDLGTTGIWIAVASSFFVAMVVSLLYYYSGRWKKAVIVKAPPIIPVIE